MGGQPGAGEKPLCPPPGPVHFISPVQEAEGGDGSHHFADEDGKQEITVLRVRA